MAKEITTPDPVALYATQAVRRVGSVVADMSEDIPTIRISGPMYSDMQGSSRDFMEAHDSLKSLGAKEARLEINSGGGSITEGIAIYDAIAASDIEFDCFIFGICASAATLPAMSCRSITIAKNARLMIHEARSGSYGTADDLEEVAAWLRRMNDTAIAAYVARTGRTEEDIRALAKEETWYHSGQDAVDAGFADRVLDVEAVAEVSEAELRAFDNAPEDLREAVVAADEGASDADTQDDTVSDDEGAGGDDTSASEVNADDDANGDAPEGEGSTAPDADANANENNGDPLIADMNADSGEESVVTARPAEPAQSQDAKGPSPWGQRIAEMNAGFGKF
ncbi:ATP-dependent protease ClpP protease subunit [Roseovarius halotolerans]|uniref:ATP-dependent Clp protease proteolytic subunit n=1 Tax=Roseovarius halotolerans TaxID=505353 RepID=A0A1X6Y5B5_9RHOB|nr:head maturation protease, ClpP-related [Roseovarius halotolerans]RKT35296.1 ATP-dependent protease ClpP protease subunit [Roseovarius halotolerans]SLN11154.1 ATP-dependent Clp protease proteolytic subunit [Roseovarius halotolerans]